MEGTVVIEGKGPYEEDFKAALVEYVRGYERLSPEQRDELTADMIREFFFVKGRESARVVIVLEDGEIRANAGVKVAVASEDNASGYMHGDVRCFNDNCDSEDCEYVDISVEDRLTQLGQGFEDLALVENPIEF